MNKNKNDNLIQLDQFFNYYISKMNHLEKNGDISSNRMCDFKLWFNEIANPIFEEMKSFLNENADKDKINSLIEFNKMLLEKNVLDNDYEGLVGNLYLIPEKIKASFEKFYLLNKHQVIEDKIELSIPCSGKLYGGYEISCVTGDLNLGSPVLTNKKERDLIWL